MKTVQQSILERIKAENVMPKPRWRFRLESALLSVVAVIIGLGAIYLFSFIAFYLHHSGLMLIPSFGLEGITFFVLASPWILISLALVFLILLSVLVKHFSFNYRRPLVTLIAMVVAGVALTSMALHAFSVHDKMRLFAEQYRVPGLSPLYTGAATVKYPEVIMGTVEMVTAANLLVRDRGGEKHFIYFKETKESLYPEIGVGDYVLVFAKMESSGKTTAIGVKRLRRDRYETALPISDPCVEAQCFAPAPN